MLPPESVAISIGSARAALDRVLAMNPSRAVLVVGPSWVGDMVMAQSLFMTLKGADESVAIDVIAPPWSLPLLARMPEVRVGIELDAGHGVLAWRKRRVLAQALRDRGYAQAIVLPRSLKAALVPFLAHVPRRTGFRGEYRYGLINDIRRFDPDMLDQTVKRFVALGADSDSSAAAEVAVPPPRLRTDAENWRRLASRFALGGGEKIIAIMPGAEYGVAKRWPVERYAELCKRLAASGHRLVVLGSQKERELGAQIAAHAGTDAVIDLCGRTELVDTVDILGAAAAAVTNDSGLLHVAAAVGTHVTAIYGSSTPDFTPPLTSAKTLIYLGLPCSPCFARVCPLDHFSCMMSIAVSTVEAAVLEAIAARV
jgi:lipopolysaccharide heptosyltransferase II